MNKSRMALCAMVVIGCQGLNVDQGDGGTSDAGSADGGSGGSIALNGTWKLTTFTCNNVSKDHPGNTLVINGSTANETYTVEGCTGNISVTISAVTTTTMSTQVNSIVCSGTCSSTVCSASGPMAAETYNYTVSSTELVFSKVVDDNDFGCSVGETVKMVYLKQ
jgi:hypothetical protein